MKHGLLFCCVLSLSAIVQPTVASSLISVERPYSNPKYAKTKYPLVLVHGFAIGFNRIGTKTFGLDYFYQILPDLTRNGATAYAVQLSPVESTEVRGEQLLEQVNEVIALTGQNKVNLIGHSHGGPTIRYIEGVAPEKVASLTAIAGSIKGTPLGDKLMDDPILSAAGKLIIGNLLAPAIAILKNNPNLSVNYDKSIYDISKKGAAEFNAKYPSAAIPISCNSDGVKLTSNGVYHYSWTGSAKITNILDVIDSAIVGAGIILMPNTESDGLVPICDSKYGKVIRNDYNLNHFDEVNQFLGLRGLFSQDPVQIFREHANRLQAQGL